MAQFQINRYKDVPIRPLNKGMYTDLPPNGIPEGGFVSIKNMRVKPGYLETRGGIWPLFDGYVPLSGSDLISYDFTNLREKIQNVVFHWKTNAQSETLIITDEFLYTVGNRDTIFLKEFASGSLTTSGASVSSGVLTFGISAGTEDNIAVGDYFREFSTTDIVGRLINIDAGVYSVQLDPGYTWGVTAVEFVHAFNTRPGFSVDYTILGGYGTTEAGNVFILTDQAGRGIYSYANDALTVYATDSSPLKDGVPANQTLGSAKACTYYDDRLWLGNITEADGTERPQRIWWSDVLEFTRFDPISYMDLPYSQGELIALRPLGPNLIAYFTDTLYIGRPTSIVGRPYEFQEINTDGIGLTSQLGLASLMDGHFFVGQDDIYALTQSSGLQRIGGAVKRDTIDFTSELGLMDYVQAEPDPMTESIVFLFPDVTAEEMKAKGLATKLWRFYYKTKAWAFDEVPVSRDQPQAYFSCISHARVVNRDETYQDWYDLDGTAGDPSIQTSGFTVGWDGSKALNAIYMDGSASGVPPSGQIKWSDFGSYFDLNSFSVSAPKLLIGTYYLSPESYYVQNVVYESAQNNQDYIGTALFDIDYEVISPDYDFGHPDRAKMTRQFSVRTFEHADAYFQPQVWTSDGKAYRNVVTGEQDIRWMSAPTVKFFTDYNEGKTGFLTRGSIFKFKIKFTRSTERYRITEFVIRTMIEGEQTDA